MPPAQPSAILIAGPTASGKSGLALRLAEEHGGKIINADSMQVYAELRILTARPSIADEARVPHALYGFVPAAEAYSVGRFVVDAATAIDEARRQGRVPIIVGGTGLYFKALLEGLSPIPAIDDGVRARWRSTAEQIGAAELHRQLAARDAVMAGRLSPTDTQRIVRALEVLDSTGQSLAVWQTKPKTPILDAATATCLVVDADRADLIARADKRFDQMIADGALAEAESLAKRHLDPVLPAMRAIGVAPLIAAVRGERPLAEAIETAKAETRQYIKRQQTWLNGNMIAWNRIFA